METVPYRQEHVECLRNLDGHIIPDGAGYRGSTHCQARVEAIGGWREYTSGRRRLRAWCFLRGHSEVTSHVFADAYRAYGAGRRSFIAALKYSLTVPKGRLSVLELHPHISLLISRCFPLLTGQHHPALGRLLQLRLLLRPLRRRRFRREGWRCLPTGVQRRDLLEHRT
jgi:hypothetical protein